MSYRPITDVWLLARPKVKYYGAYPAGFLERARRLLGARMEDAVLHVCAGKVRDYPYAGGVGPNDKTFDLDPNTYPDFCGDVRRLADWPRGWTIIEVGQTELDEIPGWRAILMDPPYTEQDARHYLPGALQFPKLAAIMKNAGEVLAVGGMLGVLHYEWSRPPKLSDGATLREVAVIAVGTGRGQRARWFTVWQKFAAKVAKAHSAGPIVDEAPQQQALDDAAAAQVVAETVTVPA